MNDFKIEYREEAGRTVSYTITSAYFQTTRENYVTLDPRGNHCSCRDERCEHIAALVAIEAERTHFLATLVTLPITEEDEWLHTMPEQYHYNLLCGDYRTIRLEQGNRVAWMALPEYGIFPGEQFNAVTMARRIATRR